MKVTVAIDSLKGSLSSLEAGQAAAEGIRRVYPNAEVRVRPLADGGEGTVEALTFGMGGELQKVRVTGPLGEPVECQYGIVEERAAGGSGSRADGERSGGSGSRADGEQADGSGSKAGGEQAGGSGSRADGERAGGSGSEGKFSSSKIAVIEMSGAAGLTQVPPRFRNPMNTTTYGVGEVILDAIRKGCRRFLVGIGGSATNDGGIGMLQALGYGILDRNGNPVSPYGKGLADVAEITDDNVVPELSRCTFKVACDVTNPLCGEGGSSAVYGPQKGATPEMVRTMDGWLARYAGIAEAKYPHADGEYPGSGAAGGLGFAFLTFTDAVLEPGIRIVLEETGLEEYVKDADVVVTGEGRLDRQTVMGKAPAGVAEIAKKYGKPVLGFAGCVTEDAAACNSAGIDAFFPILRTVSTPEEAMDPENAGANMAASVEQVFRVLRLTGMR